MSETQTEEQIVVAQRLPVVELIVAKLKPLIINYDLTVEKMIAGLPDNDTNVTSEHFPDCRAGKTGIEEAQLFLVKPVPSGKRLPTQDVEEILDKDFVREELPALAVLKEYCDQLRAQEIQFITALGPNSRWANPDGGDVSVPCLGPHFVHRGFSLLLVEKDWFDYDWFVCRRK